MREILFRGKRGNGDWVYGSLLRAGGFCCIYRVTGTFELEQSYIIPESVGQYTGLRDSKRTAEYPEGQMIFEGDIVMLTTPMGKKYKSVVRFKEAKFEFFGLSNPSYFASRYAEVIGNIHDHPELLKGGEK